MSENFSLDSSEINYVVEIINYISECLVNEKTLTFGGKLTSPN